MVIIQVMYIMNDIMPMVSVKLSLIVLHKQLKFILFNIAKIAKIDMVRSVV